MVDGTTAARHYSDLQNQALALIQRYDDLDRKVNRAISLVLDQLRDALLALAQAYLPALHAADLAEAERLTGFRGFSRRDPLKAMEREAHVLQSTIARIQAEERYQRREYLVGPVGELTRERAETLSMLEPWEAECARFEQLELFTELIAVGYDTPEFTGRFWQASYWKHWAAGDAICEALGMDDFGDDVLPAWLKVSEERRRWQHELARIDDKIDQVHGLVQQHDQAVARLPRLPEIYLEGSWKLLAEHLEHADPALLDEWLKKEPEEHRPIRLALRRVAGLAAKTAFLMELRDDGLVELRRNLKNRASKYGRKSQKYMRPKYRHAHIPDSHIDRKFAAKADKLEDRQQKVEGLVERLLAYDAYERFALDQEPELWWREMTGKRPDRMTPRLRSWYDRHPDARPATDPSVDVAAHAIAAAAADRDLDELDYLS